MHLQKVQNPPLKAIQGVLVVLGLIAVIVLASVVLQLLSPWIGAAAASIAFWVVGIGVALWTTRRFIMSYTYALNGVMLKVTFAYGRYERAMREIYLNNVVFAGAPEAVRKRYPDARVQRAIRPRCSIDPFAVAYNDGNRIAIFVLQPDDEIRTALSVAAHPKKKARAKQTSEAGV